MHLLKELQSRLEYLPVKRSSLRTIINSALALIYLRSNFTKVRSKVSVP